MTPRIQTLEDAKGYATEKNLRKALARTGLDAWELATHIFIVRKADGAWTAIFRLDTNQGGYIAAAANHGFFTV